MEFSIRIVVVAYQRTVPTPATHYGFRSASLLHLNNFQFSRSQIKTKLMPNEPPPPHPSAPSSWGHMHIHIEKGINSIKRDRNVFVFRRLLGSFDLLGNTNWKYVYLFYCGNAPGLHGWQWNRFTRYENSHRFEININNKS